MGLKVGVHEIQSPKSRLARHSRCDYETGIPFFTVSLYIQFIEMTLSTVWIL